MLTSGLLLITDAAVTLAWQEPVSAVFAKLQQGRLEDELERTEERFGDSSARLGEVRAFARHLARRTRTGDAIGRIELPTLGRLILSACDPLSARERIVVFARLVPPRPA
jgi:sortase A